MSEKITPPSSAPSLETSSPETSSPKTPLPGAAAPAPRPWLSVVAWGICALLGSLLWGELLLQLRFAVPLIPILAGLAIGLGMALFRPASTAETGIATIIGWGVVTHLGAKIYLAGRLLGQAATPGSQAGILDPTTLTRFARLFSPHDVLSIFYATLAIYWVFYMFRRKDGRDDIPLPDNKFQRNDILIAQIALLVVAGIFATLTGTFPSIEILAMGMVGLLIWYPRHRAFLKDLLPVLFTLLTYESLRVFADDLAPSSIHITDLIQWEMALFGGNLPIVWVQNLLWDRSISPMLTVIFTGFYYSHFILPLILITLLWQKRRILYWPFVGGFVTLMLSAFVTYIVFPAAPPWWATYYGYLTGELAVRSYPAAEMMFQGPNPVAAMPSLHMASPVFIALFTTLVWRRRALWLWIFPVGVGLSTLYLGHHYVIDLIAGSLYAGVIFGVLYRIVRPRLETPPSAPTGFAQTL